MTLSCSKILTEKQMAKKLGISEKSLLRLRFAGKVPWRSLMGKPRYYEDEVVEAFLKNDLNRGPTYDPRETNQVRSTARRKGQVREEGVLEKIYIKEGSGSVGHRD